MAPCGERRQLLQLLQGKLADTWKAPVQVAKFQSFDQDFAKMVGTTLPINT